MRPLAILATVLFAVFAGPASAVTLDDVRHSLAELKGDSTLRVRIESMQRRNDGKQKTESTSMTVAEDDGTSIRLVHDKKELQKRIAARKPGRAETEMSSVDAFELMNFGPALLKLLQGATVKKVSATTLDGAAVTLFEVVPVREKDEDGDRWIKEYADSLLLWVADNGYPVAAERTLHVKARIVVIGVELNKKDKYRFAHVADRLLVGAQSVESTSSGFGKNETRFETAKVIVAR
jgi:hypothetical protein